MRRTTVDRHRPCRRRLCSTHFGSSPNTCVRLQTGSWGAEHEIRATRCVYNDSNGAHYGADDFDTEKRVSFLTDKCNALARRLQQVETQLVKERTEGEKRVHDAEAALCCSQSVESSNNSSNLSYSCDSAQRGHQPHPGASSSSASLGHSPRTSGGSSRALSRAPRSSTPDFDNRGGSDGGKTSNVGAGVERTAVACPTPRTAGSNNNRAHLLPGKGHAQGQQQQRPHSSGVVLSGVMMPPDVVQAIRDSKKPRGSGGGSKLDAEALHCEVVEKEIADRFDVVTDGIERLENVFSGAAQILEHRVRAITTISRYVVLPVW